MQEQVGTYFEVIKWRVVGHDITHIDSTLLSLAKDTIMINATMDLNVWETQNALASIHEACLELHTGADGVSKTWDEVGISAKILTVKK